MLNTPGLDSRAMKQWHIQNNKWPLADAAFVGELQHWWMKWKVQQKTCFDNTTLNLNTAHIYCILCVYVWRKTRTNQCQLNALSKIINCLWMKTKEINHFVNVQATVLQWYRLTQTMTIFWLFSANSTKNIELRNIFYCSREDLIDSVFKMAWILHTISDTVSLTEQLQQRCKSKSISLVSKEASF